MTDATLRCPFHPEREGVGICVACRRVVCADCATKLDGINHCRGCLEAKIGKATRRPGAARRALERVVALGAIAFSFLVLTAIFYAIGINAADIGWFGTGLSDTARALEQASDAISRFHKDTGRFPSEREGLAALFSDEPIPGAGPIARWEGPYLSPRIVKSGAQAEEVRDGYGSRLRYVGPAGRGRPAVLSIGPNRQLDTDLARLRRGDPAGGDDSIRWVQ